MKLGCVTSFNIWKCGVEYNELAINERQKNDGEYSVLLDSVRHGHLNEDAISLMHGTNER